MKGSQYPSAQADKFILRMEPGMREKLKAIAALNRRSMNNEINMRLADSLSVDDVRRLDEVKA